MAPIQVALLAGRRRSLASLLMLSELDSLRARGVQVAAVLAVSEFRWSRLLDWYRRFGLRAIAKGLGEFGLRAAGGVDEEQAVLREQLRRRWVSARSLPELCRECEIPFHLVSDVNGSQSLNLLARYGCDYGIYSGAGILRGVLGGQQQAREGVRHGHAHAQCPAVSRPEAASSSTATCTTHSAA